MTHEEFSWQNSPYHCTSEHGRLKPAGRVWGTGLRLGLRTSNYRHKELGSLFTLSIFPSKRLAQIHFLPQNKKANLKTAFHIIAVMLTLVGKMGNLCRHERCPAGTDFWAFSTGHWLAHWTKTASQPTLASTPPWPERTKCAWQLSILFDHYVHPLHSPLFQIITQLEILS